MFLFPTARNLRPNGVLLNQLMRRSPKKHKKKWLMNTTNRTLLRNLQMESLWQSRKRRTIFSAVETRARKVKSKKLNKRRLALISKLILLSSTNSVLLESVHHLLQVVSTLRLKKSSKTRKISKPLEKRSWRTLRIIWDNISQMKSKRIWSARKEKTNILMKRKSRHSMLKIRKHYKSVKKEEDTPRVNSRAVMKRKKMVLYSTRLMPTLNHPEAVVSLSREEDVAVKRRSISLMRTSQLCDERWNPEKNLKMKYHGLKDKLTALYPDWEKSSKRIYYSYRWTILLTVWSKIW